MTKTTVSAATTVFAIILLASFVVKLSFAVPLHPSWLNQVFDDSETGVGREENAVDYNPISHQKEEKEEEMRYKRAIPFPVTSNYSLTVFNQRKKWKSTHCSGLFNCAPVSPMHCEKAKNIIDTTSDYSDYNYGCDLKYSISVEVGSVAEGAELALYKKRESEPEGGHLKYIVFISYKRQNESSYKRILATRYIDWSCHSWQIFNISDIKGYLPANIVHHITLLVTVFKETVLNQTPMTTPLLSCAETRSLFVINSTVNMDEYINGESHSQQEEVQPTESVTESASQDEQVKGKDLDMNGDGDSKENSESNQTPGFKLKDEEGSGAAEASIKPEVPVATISAAAYIPVFSLFTNGSSVFDLKRSVDEQLTNDNMTVEAKATSEADKVKDVVSDVNDNKTVVEEVNLIEHSGDMVSVSDCRRIEKKVTIREIAPRPTCATPEIVDIGMCSSSANDVKCLPSNKQDLYVLCIDNGHATIEKIQDKIIVECMPEMTG